MVEATRTLSSAPPRRRATSNRLLALAVLAVGAQLYGLYVPFGGGPSAWFPGADKVPHVLAFAVPVLLVITARAARTRLTARFWILSTAAFAGQALASELAQHAFYRFRTGDPYDLLADAVGIALGLAGARSVLARGVEGAGR